MGFPGGKMFKRVLSFIGLISFTLTVGFIWTHGLGTILLRVAPWAFLTALIIGTTVGIIGSRIKHIPRSEKLDKQSERHTIGSIIEHWGTAIGIFILMVSGFQIRSHSGFSATNLHFLGLFLILLFGSYFITDFFAAKKYEALLPDGNDIVNGTLKKYLFKVASKETGKYLSSQKSAFLVFVILGGQIFFSGVIKLLPFYIHVPTQILQSATILHDVSAFLFMVMLIIHVCLVVALRAHRPLLRSWFTGKHPKGHEPKPVEPVNLIPEELKITHAESLVEKFIIRNSLPSDDIERLQV
jgi:cytochrome b subunit of formate dehydrogenase